MRSFARLNYQQVQMAIEGEADIEISRLSKDIITPLFLAYKALCKARDARNPLDLELPEKRIIIDNNGKISDVIQRPRYDSHKLIEEFMITANVAAAIELEKKSKSFLYRVHAEPPSKNLESLRSFLKPLGYNLSKGQVLTPLNFNQILKKSKNSDVYEAVTQMILRSQSQAVYADENIGHFGLSLRRYCHFTSPIRRYSDLIVHRALISANSLGEGGFLNKDIDIAPIAEHTSITERRASKAERQSTDRFAAAYLSDKIGEKFKGRVNGVAKFGLFISLDRIGADGLIPIRSLTDDFYKFNERRMLLKGSRNGAIFSLGMCVEVVIKESNPVSGSLLLELADTHQRSKLRGQKQKKRGK
jgi:ribonuclease R